MTRYAKTIAALLGAVGTWGATAMTENGIDGAEWFGLLVALGTVAAVYGIPNEAPGLVDDPNISERPPSGERGQVVTVLVVVLLVILILILLGAI